MGSVRHLYTTGDNDPHYFYCDACGSFALEHWTTPETPRDLGPPRRRLGLAAALTATLAFVAAWRVWLAPDLDPETAHLAAAASAVLLLFRPELSAEEPAGVDER